MSNLQPLLLQKSQFETPWPDDIAEDSRGAPLFVRPTRRCSWQMDCDRLLPIYLHQAPY